MTEYEKNLQRLQKIAQEQGLALNPDQERVEKVVGLMTANFEAVGEYICPCKQKSKPPVKGADILCPCPEMAEEIEKSGHCFCRLFFSPSNCKTKPIKEKIYE